MQGPVESTTAASPRRKTYSGLSERIKRFGLYVSVAAALGSAGTVYSNQGSTDQPAKGFQPDAVVNQGPLPLAVIQDLIQAGKFDEAEAALNTQPSSGPQAGEASALRQQLAMARQAAAEITKAEGQATQAIALRGAEQKQRGEVVHGYLAQGIKALAENDYVSSESYFQQALQVDPKNADAQEGLKRVQEAKASGKPATTKPASAESAGSLLLPESEKTRQTTIEDVALAQAADLFQKGFQAEQRGSLEEASDYYNQVLALFPNSEDAKRRLLTLESNKAEEMTASGPPVRTSPATEDPVLKAAPAYDKGQQAFKAGQYQEAKAHFQEVLSIIPDHTASQQYIEQCVALEQAGGKQDNLQVAIKEVDSPASGQASVSPDMAFKKGQEQFSAGDLKQAHASFERVPANSANYEMAQVYLGRIEGVLGSEVLPQASGDQSTNPVVAQADTASGNDPWEASSDGWKTEVVHKKQAAAAASEPVDRLPGWNEGGKPSLMDEISEESDGLSQPVRVAEAEAKPLQPMAEMSAPVEAPETAPVVEATESASPAAPEATGIPTTQEGKVKEYIEVGVRSNEKGDILTAYEMWQKALQLDPQNPTAQAFIEKYADEYAEAQRNLGLQNQRNETDQRVEQLLNEKTFKLEQDQSVNISSILSTMGAIADLQIITGEGVDGDIHALRTTEMTYREVLDRVLKLNGYNWKRDPGTNVIEVTRDIIPKRFPLTEEQYQALKRLAVDSMGGKETDDPSEALREVILGKVEPKDIDATIPGRKFFLSRQMMELVVIDSRHNVELVEQFINLYKAGSIQVDKKPLVVETFKLPKTGGENLARIISLRLFGEAEFKSDFKDDQPYILYDEKTNILIIRQSPDKLELVKRLMRDSEFVKQVSEHELKARRFTVVPAEDTRSDTPDAMLRRRKQVEFTKNVFKSLLYGDRSIEEAAAEGRVMYPDPDGGTIDVVDTSDNLRKVEEYLQGITENRYLNRVKVVLHRDVTELAYALQDMVLDVSINETEGRELSEDATDSSNDSSDRQNNQDSGTSQNTQYGMFGLIRVLVTADVQTKRLIISGYEPSELDRAEDLVELLDVAPDQVEIEVRLVELSYDSSDSLGVTMTIANLLEIDDNDEDGPGFTLADAASSLVSIPNGATGSSLTLATLGRTTIDATLNFLSQFSDVRVLTAPKVTVVSGRQGFVNLGETIPYVSGYTTVVPAGSDTPVLQSTMAAGTYGFTLNTMPFVTGDGHIELELQPTIDNPGDRSEIPNPITGSLDAVGQPYTATRSAVVRVRVKDGSTLVMGGMMSRTLSHNEGRTPLLGYIPGLAPLFTEKSDTETVQNLLILVTARIIPED